MMGLLCSCPICGPCAAGTTACPGGFLADTCQNLQIDPSNCGGCGVVCPAAAPSCQSGTCAPIADAGPVLDAAQCDDASFCEGVDGGPIASDASTGTGTPPSCAPGGRGKTNCGPGGSGTESCCTSLEVEGGTFDRAYSWEADAGGPSGEGYPAMVSSFRLDKYDVTVGRFRQFAAAWSNGWTPQAGSGKHTHLNGGLGLIDVGASSAAGTAYETGWLTSDNANVAPTNVGPGPSVDNTWTSIAAGQENLPINYANWYEAYAFCIWDGGFLPSVAEEEYAAAGGDQQRQYPWGTAPPGTANQYAIYNCNYPSMANYPTVNGMCFHSSVAMIAPVGTPALGAGRWGQLDLTGEVMTWALDWAETYVEPSTPCTDCAYLDASSARLTQGCDYRDDVGGLVADEPGPVIPTERAGGIGFRCARTP